VVDRWDARRFAWIHIHSPKNTNYYEVDDPICSNSPVWIRSSPIYRELAFPYIVPRGTTCFGYEIPKEAIAKCEYQKRPEDIKAEIESRVFFAVRNEDRLATNAVGDRMDGVFHKLPENTDTADDGENARAGSLP
jgi:hypothetical protein